MGDEEGRDVVFGGQTEGCREVLDEGRLGVAASRSDRGRKGDNVVEGSRRSEKGHGEEEWVGR